MDTSGYEHALEVWSAADLATLQKNLDSDILEVKNKESLSLESRKSLAAETKKFKKLDSDEKLANVNKIIKQYQHEIDNLTQRSKFSEQTLLDIYTKLSETPDPKPLLQHSIEKLRKLREYKGLEEKVTDLEGRIAKYADYETLKKRLLELEQNSAVTLAKRLAAKEQELTSIWKEKERNWKEKEVDINKQIELLQENNKALEAKISRQVDIGGETAGDSTETGGTADGKSSAEFNLLAQELESAQSRIMILEQRNEELSGSLAKATSAAEKESEVHTQKLKISHLEGENALLSASLERESNVSKNDKTELQNKIKSLQSETESYKGELETVKRKLSNYSDYNQLKNELSALKKIEFGADSESENEHEDGEANESIKVDNTFITANKKLQASLVELRVDNNSKKEENEKLKKEAQRLKSQVERLESLNTQLEADLEKVDDVDQKFNDTASVMSTVTRKMNNRSGRRGKLSPTSSIVGLPEEDESFYSEGSNTILPIVTKQRDRFRARNTDLEKQVRQGTLEKNRFTAEITKLKEDNVKLYERIRYLSSYSGDSVKDTMSFTDIDAENQYSNSYDESLHPLAYFKKKQMSYYKKNRLSVFEKIFVAFANVVLQNKTSRMLFMFYCVGLHGLVFIMSMYVININGYLTPDVGTLKTASASKGGAKIIV
ncbi:CCAAT displacement transcription factor COY1 KNAG_0C00940 [Huiozyma naganishii CBS 8797]|uniref:Protein CASP n=1 Tax=Huiozyma naganishii (strain ATCC MYA-139 / BCRC 22969 / CBS 8797 / KCTC 17520 / NBRC 10181 / NCYC 3082 / Yp74L-3) TaxID=1071383 RepID=J7RW49_HUIN7|nr:hypothetical protein KNAG_0C00940 [Kazachstania naganishii CBS 8797]CCK69207.1 hypothetical protein KNAG_0C00940 [Kazachstania naganishii CBS 8797]